MNVEQTFTEFAKAAVRNSRGSFTNRSMRVLCACLLGMALLVGAVSCATCGIRAVPIVPLGLYGDTNNTNYTYNYNYFNSTYWYTLGSWLVNNATSAPSGVNVTGAFEATNVSTDLICVGGTCISNWSEAGNASGGDTPAGSNRTVQFNYNNAFAGVDSFRYYLNDDFLYLSNNGTHGRLLIINGTAGVTSFTGNDISMDRVGPSYLTATDSAGSLYLGAGNTKGGIVLRHDTKINTMYLSNVGVGVYKQPVQALDVKGAIHATINVSAPLLNASCIILDNEKICNWTAINNSGVFVPYTGATQSVDLGVYNITAANASINGNIEVTGNITNPHDSEWGVYNNGSCIVIGNLSYVSEC